MELPLRSTKMAPRHTLLTQLSTQPTKNKINKYKNPLEQRKINSSSVLLMHSSQAAKNYGSPKYFQHAFSQLENNLFHFLRWVS